MARSEPARSTPTASRASSQANRSGASAAGSCWQWMSPIGCARTRTAARPTVLPCIRAWPLSRPGHSRMAVLDGGDAGIGRFVVNADPGRNQDRPERRHAGGDSGAGARGGRAVDRSRAACRGRRVDPGRSRCRIRCGPLGVVPARSAGHRDRASAVGSGVLCPPGPPGRGRWPGRAPSEARDDTSTVRTRLLGGAGAYHRLRHCSLRQVGGPLVGSAASAADAAGRLDRRRCDLAGPRRHADATHRRTAAT